MLGLFSASLIMIAIVICLFCSGEKPFDHSHSRTLSASVKPDSLIILRRILRLRVVHDLCFENFDFFSDDCMS